MSERKPTEKLLLYTDSQRTVRWGEAARWAEAFGVDCAGRSPSAPTLMRVGSQRPSSRRRDLPFAFLFEVVVQAYAEGWIGLDEVPVWADEWNLHEADTMKLLEHCAIEGHDHEPRPLRRPSDGTASR